MEPPSSIGPDQGNLAGQHSDDPLSRSISDTYLIVTRPFGDDDSPAEGYAVCAYSARTGLAYLGQGGTTAS